MQCKWAMIELQANQHSVFFSLNTGKAHWFHPITPNKTQDVKPGQTIIVDSPYNDSKVD